MSERQEKRGSQRTTAREKRKQKARPTEDQANSILCSDLWRPKKGTLHAQTKYKTPQSLDRRPLASFSRTKRCQTTTTWQFLLSHSSFSQSPPAPKNHKRGNRSYSCTETFRSKIQSSRKLDRPPRHEVNLRSYLTLDRPADSETPTNKKR